MITWYIVGYRHIDMHGVFSKWIYLNDRSVGFPKLYSKYVAEKRADKFREMGNYQVEIFSIELPE